MSCFGGSAADQRIDDVLNSAKWLLDTGGGLLGLSPIPGLDVAASTLSFLIGMVLQARGNEGTRTDLANNIQTLAAVIDKTLKQANAAISKTEGSEQNKKHDRLITSPELEERVSSLIRNLQDLTKEAAKLGEGSFFIKCLRSSSNADTLSTLKGGVEEATRNFTIQGQITIEMLINGVVENIQRIDNNVEVMMHNQQDDMDEKALEGLPYVNARYSSALNPTTSGVLEGTRVCMLEELTRWTRGPEENGRDPLIYVLSGGAGTGKSTIAVEMSKRLDDEKTLGASFFFVRGAEKLNTARYVLATLAYQLARAHKDLYPHIVAAARAYLKQGKQGQQLEFDLEDLIINPLKNVSPSHPRLIIVIDALDECTETAQDEVVRLLYLFLQRLPEVPFALRILLTTRPEMHIQDALDSVEFRKVLKPFRLHDIPLGIVDADITLFLRAKLALLSCGAEIFAKRPKAVDELTKRAAGLFIYAATIINFLKRDTEHAIDFLDILFSESPEEVAFSLKQLDRLYLTVLRNAFSHDDLKRPGTIGNLQTVLGSLALLQDHVSANVLEDLVGVSVKDTKYALRRLGSVILAPEDEKGDIRMLHASFPQYLIDKERCENEAFYIDPSIHHARLASASLALLSRKYLLTENICKLQDCSVPKQSIPDLQDRVKKNIPAHLQYACIHWATHLSESEASPQLLDLLVKFMTTKLMIWLEALSYMNRLEVAAPALLAARTWYQHNAGDKLRTDMLDLMNDGYRLMLEFFLPINLCPEQLYISAFPLAPSCKLTEIYAHLITSSNRPIPMRLATSRNSKWGSCLRVIESGARVVYCTKFSPNGRWLVSGSSDKAVQVWDARTGTLGKTLVGHTDEVVSIAWAPHGRRFASGSRDGTFRVWDMASGAQVHIQRVHRSNCAVFGIAWAPDAKHVITGVAPGGLQVWNIVNGREAKTGKTVRALTCAVDVSKDASRAVDGSADGKIRLWEIDMAAGERDATKVLEGHESQVNGVVFLHNDTQVASCANDKTIRVWDVESGKTLHVVQAHSVEVTSLAVSQKGDVVASGSGFLDRSIRVWDSKTWELLYSLQDHTNSLTSVSFSPDDERLASSAMDSTIRLWDLSQRGNKTSSTEPIVGHKSAITGVIFSRDGSRIATVSTDETVMIWTAPNWEKFCVLPGIIGNKGSAAFSLDGLELAVAAKAEEEAGSSSDYGYIEEDTDRSGLINIWDISTSTPRIARTLPNAAFEVEVLAWSNNGLWIAGGTDSRESNPTLRIWEATTGQILARIELDFSGPQIESTDYLEFSEDDSKLYIRTLLNDQMVFQWKEGNRLNAKKEKWKTRIESGEFCEEDGWIMRAGDVEKTKLCWIPGSRRGEVATAVAGWGDYYAVGGGSGQFTVLQLGNVPKVNM